MFPLFTPIHQDLFANIVTSGKGTKFNTDNSINASELVPFVRVISGTGGGLIMQTNLNIAVVDTSGTVTTDKNGRVIDTRVPSLYGSKNNSGFIGYDWNGNPIYPFATPFTGELVLRPSPIVTNLEVREGKDQISRSANLVIKCFNLAQAEMVQQYFMEPGHSLLIEYGWNSERALAELLNITDAQNNPISKDEISIVAAENNINAAKLDAKRLRSLGEYDSFFGFIVGGDFASENENYILTIKLRGMPGLPTYLQLHENINEIETVNENGKQKKRISASAEAPLYGNSEINDGNNDINSLSFRRWKWLFNLLPATRQTFEVRKLVDAIRQSNSPIGYWDLINFDYVVESQITDFSNDSYWENFKQQIGLEKEFAINGIKVPKEKLVSKHKYIRFEKAIEILNRNNGLIGYKVGDKIVKVRIETNGFIGAFPGIFSTKPQKLIIPGKIPDFQKFYLNTEKVDIDTIINNPLIDLSINVAYQTTKAPLATKTFLNQNPGYFAFNFNTMQQGAPNQNQIMQAGVDKFVTEKISFVQYSSDGKGLRPAPVDPNDPTKGSYLGITEKDGYYGELGNLYINFSVFVEAMKNSINKSVREVLMDMLNEMSSAVNSFWNFQLVEQIDENGDIILKIIDENWAGKNTQFVRKFYHSGEQSVFLDANLSIDIPQEMTNQIILKRQDYISNPNSKEITVGGIFSDKSDLFFKGVEYAKNKIVGKGANGSKPKPEIKLEDIEAEINEIFNNTTQDISTSGTITYKDKTTGEVVTRSSAYFLSAGALRGVPYARFNPDVNTPIGQKLANLIQAYKDKLAEIQQTAETNFNANLHKIDIVPNPELGIIDADALDITEKGVSEFLRNFRIYCCEDSQLFDILKNNKFEDYVGEEGLATSHPLPIKYSFKILGKSGIRRGDVFNIYGIPQKYRKHGFFQVIDLQHELQDNTWTTTVTGQFRQQPRGFEI